MTDTAAPGGGEWVLVPREPTPQMENAYEKLLPRLRHDQHRQSPSFSAVWEAVCAVAPPPPERSEPAAAPSGDGADGQLREECITFVEPKLQAWLDWCYLNGEDPEASSAARIATDALLAPSGPVGRLRAERDYWCSEAQHAAFDHNKAKRHSVLNWESFKTERERAERAEAALARAERSGAPTLRTTADERAHLRRYRGPTESIERLTTFAADDIDALLTALAAANQENAELRARAEEAERDLEPIRHVLERKCGIYHTERFSVSSREQQTRLARRAARTEAAESALASERAAREEAVRQRDEALQALREAVTYIDAKLAHDRVDPKTLIATTVRGVRFDLRRARARLTEASPATEAGGGDA